MSINLIVLAAGQGSRMNSDQPKVLHEIGSAPLLVHALKSGASLEPARTVVVAGVGAELVEAAALAWDDTITTVRQAEQNGTGDAVLAAKDALTGAGGDAIVLYGDTPFITPETLAAMQAARTYADVVVLGFHDHHSEARYGRLVVRNGQLECIVEFKDANPLQREITLMNSGVICADTNQLFKLLGEVTNANESGEYYLTDIVGIATKQGLKASVVECRADECIGINTRWELQEAEQWFQLDARRTHLDNGVTLQQMSSVHFAHDTVIGRDTLIEPNVVFGPGVTVESGARIRAFSHLEGCHVSRGGIIGPYARLRPGAELAEDVRIGNFVEVKNAQIDAGAKVNHLSYIGDATIGERTNVGAGTITCNYDGVFKHRTTIGADAFIGSNSMLVAPVSVGDQAFTATGSIITDDVPAEAMAIGRARQTNKPGLAKRLMDKLRAAKAAKKDK